MNLSGMFALNMEWVIRLVLAVVTGAMIGFERQSRAKEAGMGTHAIVCVAAAAITIVSKYGFDDTAKYDAARLSAQIISGIGFVGAGIIFVRNNTVQGLTTAAGIFATAGIGIAFGAGLCGLGLFTGVLIIGIQYILYRFRHKTLLQYDARISVTMQENITDISGVMNILRSRNRNPTEIKLTEMDGRRMLETHIVSADEKEIDEIISQIRQVKSVEKVSLSRKQN